MEEMVFYRCELCGNIVGVLKSGGGTLTCCGQPMKKLAANVTDGSKEKHVPVAIKTNGKIEVTVGAVAHPMTAEHYIEWIALVSDHRFSLVHLEPKMEPKAVFPEVDKATIYAYCNLHGLWKAEL